ncbi:hypothetical protein [Yersinia phage vB_YenP_AP10]|uniref:Uncharacterized protein n=1 Tax=Yersinia phage vB_YenP_AP10 TaxID=1735591 RepID=A0A0P0LA50_9CAUD|nr:hypothetical protein AU149_gp28 [Yersinia phage vB_YenP_AP10]ALK86955.1 hypothetical protein [Yersinia phage vB_YenP_AP10]
MEAVKYITIILMFGMIAKALLTLACIGKTVWQERDKE